MATAPRVSRLTDASRLLWMRIRRTDRGEAMLRQTLAAVCLFVLPAAAAEVRFDGSYRLRFNGDTNLALDETGFLSGQRHWLEHRLRLTPKIVEIREKGGIAIQASLRVPSGISAGDLVSRDRFAQLVVRNGGGLQWGDVAWQAVGALVYDPSDASRGGLYVARRVQTFAASGGDLHIWIFDGHLRHAQPLQNGLLLSVEGEAAQIYGGTSHAPNLSALGTTRVSQQGAALRLGATLRLVEAELAVGYASGAVNPFDDQATNFQMNRDYKVGLVLFDQVLMFQTQNAASRLSDPQLVGTPPPGLDVLPTEVAVTNALYLTPTLRWIPPVWNGSLRIVGSALFARAPQPVIDAYQTFIASAPVNAFGHSAGRNYGVELDGALGYRGRLKGHLGFEAGVQFGYLFPGNAFTRADGSRMPRAYATRFRATFTF